MQHLDEGTIHSWLDGALSAEEAARVEAHVKECAQCQAAVAEARGFIAASSRILTALDNAPRGVIPAATPKKRIDPMVWRVAATVLVVAAGTLVVVRNSGLTERTPDRSIAGQTSGSLQANQEMQRDTARGAEATNVPNMSKAGASETAAATETPAVISRGPAGFSGIARKQPLRAGAVVSAQQESRADEAARERRAVTGGEKTSTRENSYSAGAGAAPAAAPPATLAPNRFEAAAGRVAVAAARDAMVEEPKVRVVGTPGALGQKLTLYEIAPGDTVLLAEELNVTLSQAVTTGVSVAQPAAGIAASTERARPPAKASALTDTQRNAAAPSPAAAPTASTSFTRAPDGTNTLTWRDSATGGMIKLSGRHPRAELEEIKRRIERAKVAAADSVKKNR